jgi:hypothetical protein
LHVGLIAAAVTGNRLNLVAIGLGLRTFAHQRVAQRDIDLGLVRPIWSEDDAALDADLDRHDPALPRGTRARLAEGELVAQNRRRRWPVRLARPPPRWTLRCGCRRRDIRRPAHEGVGDAGCVTPGLALEKRLANRLPIDGELSTMLEAPEQPDSATAPISATMAQAAAARSLVATPRTH